MLSLACLGDDVVAWPDNKCPGITILESIRNILRNCGMGQVTSYEGQSGTNVTRLVGNFQFRLPKLLAPR